MIVVELDAGLDDESEDALEGLVEAGLREGVAVDADGVLGGGCGG